MLSLCHYSQVHWKLDTCIQFQAASSWKHILPSNQPKEKIKSILSQRDHAESISTIKPLRQSVRCVFFRCDANYDIRRKCHSERSLSQKCRDESICRTHALHLHPLTQPSYCIDGHEAWERLFVFEQVLVLLWCETYICLPASVVIYISASKPRGLGALDPTLPPSNNSQNVCRREFNHSVPY